MTGKLRQVGVQPALAALARGQSPSAPIVVELDPTSFCDLACPECISSPLLNKARFTRDRLTTLAEELAAVGVRAVILIGGGEPLLHPATPQVIKTLAEADVQVGLTTNGTTIDRCLDVLAEKVTWTRVSVDAASSSTSARFRPARSGGAKFEQVVANMRLLAGRKRGKLGFSYLLMSRRDMAGRVVESNFDEVESAARLAADIGCDYFEVKPEYDMGHYIIAQDEKLVGQLHEQLGRIDALQSETFAVLKPNNLDVVLSGGPTTQLKEYDWCPTLELRTLLTPSGAYVCPYHRGNARARYGDPTNTDFNTLWRGPQRREALRRIDPRTDCEFHCIRHESNLELLRISGAGMPMLAPVDQTDEDLFI
ncbi:radical SAM protein [Kribbella turkmenica]|uniref:radical SAM protein n=1 Tax=Kribbella turkmenica TaxID=2530375 RepID=UPI00192DA590|nr:radical SAM protein [Kribbella turkmenica]